MAFTFDQIFAVDPSNPANVAVNASVLIFAPGDATKAPLTLTTPDGSPLANPVPVNANGFGDAFMHATLDRVAWEGGGFTGFFTSYEGMKAVATDAQAAAEASATSAANSANLVGAPADAAIATAMSGAGTQTSTTLDTAVRDKINTPGSATATALTAAFIRAVVVAGAGIDATGATNSTTAIQAKINEAATSGVPVHFPAGTYQCAGLTVASGQTIAGYGATLKAPTTGGTIMTLINAANATVIGLTFKGSLAANTAEGLTSPGGTTEIGLRLNKNSGTLVQGCKFYDLNYGGIHAASTGNLSTGGRFDGDANRIVACHAENCFYGMDIDTRGEYLTVTASVFQRCNTGTRVKGGNNLFTGCNFNRNTLGFYVAIGTNSGHGSAVGCAFNHNGTTAVQVDEQLNGFIFTGCQFFTAKIVFNVCSGVIITGSEIGSNIQIGGGGWNTIKDCVAIGAPVVTHNFGGVTDATIVSITKLDGTVLT